MEVRFCNICNTEHNISDFFIRQVKRYLKSEEYKLYTSYECKISQRENRKEKKQEYKLENKEKIKTSSEEYRNKNKCIINEKYNAVKKTLKGFVCRIISCAKRSDKVDNKTCDIDEEYIKKLLTDQKNMCAFCKNIFDIEFGEKKLSQGSLDRINNDSGHSKGNVHLTCLFCNHARNCNSVENYKLFIDLLAGKYDEKDYEYSDCLKTISRLRSGYQDRDKKFGDVKTITTQEIKEMMKSQNYKCAISGLPLFFHPSEKRFILQPSVDRIDNTKPHRRDNCHIVCLAIQFGKLTHSVEDVKAYINKIREINK